MSAKMAGNSYGKSRVRLVKVFRGPEAHTVREITVNIQLEGKFDRVYTQGDNSNVLPTDTMKNTVYALAKDHSIRSIEEFGLTLSQYLIDHNPAVSSVTLELVESPWKRINNHPHAFIGGGTEERVTIIRKGRRPTSISSGIRHLLIMKSTDSSFTGFVKDRFTTLKETDDRILATSADIFWNYKTARTRFNSNYNTIRNALLKTFSNHKSLSVQHTLYAMGEAALKACRDIREISFTMPNMHCLLVDLRPFGMENHNEIFVPTDEPYGLIRGTIRRR